MLLLAAASPFVSLRSGWKDLPKEATEYKAAGRQLPTSPDDLKASWAGVGA